MGAYLLVGKPGSGKTTLACSMIKVGYKVHIIDVDKKSRTMDNLKDYRESGMLDIHEIKSSLQELSLADMINAIQGQPLVKTQEGMKQIGQYTPKVMPSGFLEVCEMVDNLKDHPPEDHENIVPVLDSITRVDEHLKRLMKFFAKRPRLGFDEYDAVLANYEELFDSFCHLQPDIYPHVIVNAHIRDEYDENGVIVEWKPLFTGSFRDKAASYFDECYYLQVEALSKVGKPKYKAFTAPIGLAAHARTSLNIGSYVDADFESILGKKKEVEDV